MKSFAFLLGIVVAVSGALNSNSGLVVCGVVLIIVGVILED